MGDAGIKPPVIARVEEVVIPDHGDSRGRLIALEELSTLVPFDVKRVYYAYDTQPGSVRGNHAHLSLRQFVICVSGAFTFVCERPDGTRSEHRLDWPNKGLLVEGLVWREIKDFSKDSVMLVLASEHYNEADYIRDYDEFVRLAGRSGAK